MNETFFLRYETICLLISLLSEQAITDGCTSSFVCKRENAKHNSVLSKVFYLRTKTLATRCHLNCFNAIAFPLQLILPK